jgi:hypothetical protein
MSTHKTVYNKLFSKQELSTEKVELSLISDIDSAFDRALKSEQRLGKQLQGLELDAKTASNDYQIAINLGKNALAKAKELGADDLIRVINARISEAEVNKKEMDSIESKLKSMII